MKKTVLFACIMLAYGSAFCQLDVDKSINLSGTGNNARIMGVKSVADPLDAANAASVQTGALVYDDATGSGGNYAVTLAPAPTAYTSGMIVNFKANHANSGAATLQVNGLTPAKAIKVGVTNDLAAGDIANNQMVSVIYDGTNFQLLSRGATVTTLPPSGPAGGDLTGTYPNPDIAANAVTTNEIANGTIVTADLAANSVTSNEIVNGTIVTADLAANSVTTNEIVNGTIATADIATGAVTSNEIANATITATDLATTGVTAGGPYNNVQVNAQGQVTGASNVAYLTGNQTITLSGDVSGSGTTAISTSVDRINGAALGTTTPSAGRLLIGNGTQWASTAVSGDATLSSAGVLTLNTNSNNYIKNQTTVQSSSNFNISGNGTVGGDLAVNGGDVNLGNGTSNLISYVAAGVAPPAVTTRSAGTKIVFYPGISATNVDYAMGIQSSSLWYSVPQASSSQQHIFYGGTSELMRIRGDGNVGVGTTNPTAKLYVNGTATVNGVATFIESSATYAFSGDNLSMQYTSATTRFPYIQWLNSAGTRGMYLGWGSPGSYIDMALENGNDLRISGGNVGIGTPTAINHALVANGTVVARKSMVANAFLATNFQFKIAKQNATTTDVALNGPDGAFHRLQLDNGYALVNYAIYASQYMDGGLRGNGIFLDNILTTTHTWRGVNAAAAPVGNTSYTGTNALCDDCRHTCNCADNEVVTGIEIWSATHLEGALKVRCTALASGFTTTNTGMGVESAISIPYSTGYDDVMHHAICPTGTLLKGITIWASSRMDGELRAYCTGITAN